MSDDPVKKRLSDMVRILDTISAQQLSYQDYCADVAAAMVEGELRLLEAESLKHWQCDPAPLGIRTRAR